MVVGGRLGGRRNGKALDEVLPLLLGLPIKVLKEKYGWGTQKRLPDFADALLEAYEESSKNERSMEDLMKQVEQDCDIRFMEDEVCKYEGMKRSSP